MDVPLIGVLCLLVFLCNGAAAQTAAPGCAVMRLNNTTDHLSLHGDYALNSGVTCLGQPIYMKNGQHLYFHTGNIWVFSDRQCANETSSNWNIQGQDGGTFRPDMVRRGDWKEKPSGSWVRNNNITVWCVATTDPCVPNLCVNGGTCSGNRTCQCRPGYTGALCETLLLSTTIPASRPGTPSSAASPVTTPSPPGPSPVTTPSPPGPSPVTNTPMPTTPTVLPQQDSCYICESEQHDVCAQKQTSPSPTTNCDLKSGNACWVKRLIQSSKVSYHRYCAPAGGCVVSGNAYACQTVSNSKECKKCCTSHLCNDEEIPESRPETTTPSSSLPAQGQLSRHVLYLIAIVVTACFLEYI